ncbi:MAG: hypothetical protein J6Y29_00895 [Clostridiales bacterium]|nr:hypothetical protein [Clostridiales bacterium]
MDDNRKKVLLLFKKQKELLDTFVSRDAISKEQYIISLNGLIEKMNITKEELEEIQKDVL